jgi:hypothetical protein
MNYNKITEAIEASATGRKVRDVKIRLTLTIRFKACRLTLTISF